MPWARIGELMGHDDLMTTARTYTHVVADERELDYANVLRRPQLTEEAITGFSRI